MSEIVRELIDHHGLSEAEIEKRLGMEAEEIEWLYDNAPIPARAGQGKDFAKGWMPKRGHDVRDKSNDTEGRNR